MNNTRATLLVMTLVFVFIKPSRAQEQNCKEIGAAAQMARAKTTRAVNDARKQAGESYLARLVFAYRFFHLHPKSKAAAESLLSLIPADNTQQKIVLTLGDSLCDEESVADIKVLARVNEGLAQGLAAAVLLSPRFLSSYVSYSTTAFNHGDRRPSQRLRSAHEKGMSGGTRRVHRCREAVVTRSTDLVCQARSESKQLRGACCPRERPLAASVICRGADLVERVLCGRVTVLSRS